MQHAGEYDNILSSPSVTLEYSIEKELNQNSKQLAVGSNFYDGMCSEEIVLSSPDGVNDST